jgi:MFS family permease
MPRPSLIVLLCITIGANTFSIGAFAPLLPEIGAAGGLSDLALGALAGMFGFARMLTDVPAGVLLKRHLQRALVVAPLVLVAGVLCLGSGGPLPVLLLGRGLMGLGHSLAMVGALTAVLRLSRGTRLGAALNSIELSGMLGLLGGVTVVGSISRALPWNVALLVACAPLAISVAILPWLRASLRRIAAAETAPAPAPLAGAGGAHHPWLVPLAFATGACMACTYSTIEQFLIPLRGSRHFALERAGIAHLLQIGQLTDIAALLPAGVISDRRGPERVLAAVTLMMAGAVALIAFGSLTLVAAGCVLFGLALAGWMLPLSVIRRETMPEHIAWRTGLYRVGVDAGSFLGPFLSGLAAGWWPGLMPMALTALLAAIGALLIVAATPRVSRRVPAA